MNFFSPLGLILIAISVYVYLPFGYYWLISDSAIPYAFELTELYVFMPMVAYLFPLVVLLFILPRPLSRRPFILKNRQMNYKIVPILTLAGLVSMYGLFWWLNKRYGFNNEWQILENVIHYRLTIERDSALSIILRNLITTLAIFFVALNWYVYQRTGKLLCLLLLCVSLLLALYFALLSGRRRDLISIILLLAFFLNFAPLFKGKVMGIKVHLALGLGALFIFLMSWYSFFRKGREFQWINTDILYEFVRRFDGVFPNFYYLYNSNISNDYFFGITYVRALLNFVPRSLFPEKHENLQMYFNANLRLHADSGMDFGNFGEAWVNFGVFSLLFVSLYCVLLREFFNKLYLGVERQCFVSTALYAYTVYCLLQFFSSPIDSTNMMFYLINLAITYVAARFFCSGATLPQAATA